MAAEQAFNRFALHSLPWQLDWVEMLRQVRLPSQEKLAFGQRHAGAMTARKKRQTAKSDVLKHNGCSALHPQYTHI